MPNLHKRYKSQKGAALIAFVLLMIVGSSFLLISKLNAKVRDREDIEKTYDVLKRAKEALIGYAVSYPELSVIAPRPGPGYLPCPDRDVPGTAGSGLAGVIAVPPGGGICAFGTLLNSSLGRLPYLTIGMPDPFDGSGEVLWYALANDFRHNPINTGGANPNGLNSDAPFLYPLTIDANPNPIVAVIIAPGAALDTPWNNPGGRQDRLLGNTLPRNYLEDVNWDNLPDFVSNPLNPLVNSSSFNDKVIAITRQELMSAVEKRVLGEVANAVENYRNSSFVMPAAAVPIGYPWLVPFEDPSTSAFSANISSSGSNYVNVSANAIAGLLPLHGNNLPPTPHPAPIPSYTGPNNIFVANSNEVIYSWNLTAATINDTNPGVSWGTLSDVCLMDSDCVRVAFGTTLSLNPPPAMIAGLNLPASLICTWTDGYSVNCPNPFTFSRITGFLPCVVNSCNGLCQRQITITLPVGLTNYVGNVTSIVAPTAGIRRLREVATPSFPVANNVILVTDTMDRDPAGGAACLPSGPTFLDRKSVDLLPGTTGVFRTSVPYEIDTNGTGLDIDGDGFISNVDVQPELPPWFINNNWHQLVYVAYPAEPLPGALNVAPVPGTGVCAPPNCINIRSTQGANQSQTNRQTRALVVIAGQDLIGFRPSGLISDYFEGIIDGDLDGLDDDGIFVKQLFRLVPPVSGYNDQIRVIQTNINP